MAFLAQTDGLSTKRGPILMQLPPSFAFDAVILTTFLDQLRATFDGPVVCEPRHVTWFGPEAVELLRRYRIGLVIADPPTIPAAEIPDTGQAITYYRLHGQPRMYWSKYDESYLASLDTAMSNASHASEVWCIFDNTASGAAIENAWELCARLAPGT